MIEELEKILLTKNRCTITEEAADEDENYYFKWNDVLNAMEEALKLQEGKKPLTVEYMAKLMQNAESNCLGACGTIDICNEENCSGICVQYKKAAQQIYSEMLSTPPTPIDKKDITELQADIRNKLTPFKSLISFASMSEVDRSKVEHLILPELIETCFKNIEYLSKLPINIEVEKTPNLLLSAVEEEITILKEDNENLTFSLEDKTKSASMWAAKSLEKHQQYLKLKSEITSLQLQLKDKENKLNEAIELINKISEMDYTNMMGYNCVKMTQNFLQTLNTK